MREKQWLGDPITSSLRASHHSSEIRESSESVFYKIQERSRHEGHNFGLCFSPTIVPFPFLNNSLITIYYHFFLVLGLVPF